MMVFKRKQIVVLSLVLMIVVAGYLQYSYKKSSISVDNGNSEKLGEAVYVDSGNSVLGEEKGTKGDTNKEGNSNKDNKDSKDNKDNNKAGNESKSSKTSSASKEALEYFTDAKLTKDVSRSKTTDSLKAITENPNASKEAKNKAFDQMTKIAENTDKEARIESMVKQSGFNNVIALLGDDGSIDVVVEAQSLTTAQTAQIYDIVSRQANVDIDKIHIRAEY